MRRGIERVLLATTASIAMVTGAAAADLPVKAPPAPAFEAWNPWLIRLRAVGVIPRDHGTVAVPGVPIADPVPGYVLNVSNTVIPEIDISYFFTRNIAVELILGTTPHSIKGSGALDGLQVGKTWLLPITPTLQYHFTNFGAFQPYVGVGPNFTIFYNNSADNVPSITPLVPLSIAVTGLSIKNAWGVAAQAGFDYYLNPHVGLNFDVKKLWLSADWNGAVSIAGGAPRVAYGKADIDPWLIGAGVFYKF